EPSGALITSPVSVFPGEVYGLSDPQILHDGAGWWLTYVQRTGSAAPYGYRIMLARGLSASSAVTVANYGPSGGTVRARDPRMHRIGDQLVVSWVGHPPAEVYARVRGRRY